jgi:cytochrome c oxidase accessory protein FixG
MTLFLAGIPLRIDQFYLVLLLSLLLVAIFLLMTIVLGRVWCGWLCPQTVFNDLMDLLVNKFKTINSKIVEHILAVTIAAFVAFDLFCWFMPPVRVASNIVQFSDHPFLVTTFFLTTLLGYLNLILVKRSFCRSYCPYGRIQTALMDSGTLNLSFLEETQHRCLNCKACVHTCPMDIDIRAGFQIECINCGRCIDACRSIMERKPDGIGLIDYRFGTVKGTQFRLGSTSIVLLIITLLLAVGLVWGVSGRNQSAFAVQRVATADVRKLPDGSIAQPWRAIIGNRSELAQIYSIRIVGGSSKSAELLGQVRDIKVAANQHQEVIFMIHVTNNSNQPEKLLLQLFNGDRSVGKAVVTP